MSRRQDFVTEETPVTEEWLDDIQELLSRHIAGFRLERPTADQVRTVVDQHASLVTDSGKWRYMTTVTSLVVSGTPGIKTIYAIGGPDSGVNPSVNTNLDFSLEITAGTPAGQNPRRLGTLEFNGTTVQTMRWLAGQQPPGDLFNAFIIKPLDPAGVPLTIQGFAGQSVDLLRIGTSTSVFDRLRLSAAGQLALPVQGIDGGLVIGNEVKLYRSAVNTVSMQGSLVVVGTLATTGSVQLGNSADDTIGFFGSAGIVRPIGYAPTNVTTRRSFNANDVTLHELADAVGTIIADLKAFGLFAEFGG